MYEQFFLKTNLFKELMKKFIAEKQLKWMGKLWLIFFELYSVYKKLG